MTRQLAWTNRAIKRVGRIGDYIARDSPASADKAVKRLRSIAEHLRTHPAIGRAGRIAGTRELVLADMPYIIVYRVSETHVEILTVMHTSQRWPEEL